MAEAGQEVHVQESEAPEPSAGAEEPIWFVRAVLLLFFAAFAGYVAIQLRDVWRFW